MAKQNPKKKEPKVPVKVDDCIGSAVSGQDKPLTIQEFVAFLKKERELKKDQTPQDIKFLNSKIQEYLSSFILIGYTMNGRYVAITHANSSKDKDSLNTGLYRYLSDGGMKNMYNDTNPSDQP